MISARYQYTGAKLPLPFLIEISMIFFTGENYHSYFNMKAFTYGIFRREDLSSHWHRITQASRLIGASNWMQATEMLSTSRQSACSCFRNFEFSTNDRGEEVGFEAVIARFAWHRGHGTGKCAVRLCPSQNLLIPRSDIDQAWERRLSDEFRFKPFIS